MSHAPYLPPAEVTDIVRDDALPLPAKVDLLADEVAERERTIEHLQLALHNSRRLGMATGILMARRGVDRAGALDLLTRASRRRGCKLVTVADQVVEHGDLLDG